LADGSEFTGDYRLTVNELVAFHRPRVEAALAAKPDLILFETLPSLAEAKAVDLLAEAFPHVPFMASFSAKPGSLCSGESFAEAVGLLEPKDNVVAVGLNCSAPAVIGPLLQSVRPRRLLLGASPNSGETWSAIERRWVGAASRVDDFGVLARQYVEAGARIVGGCCRTTPEDIARIRHAFPSRTQPKQ
jgi:homocysteine S-methyltransferase